MAPKMRARFVKQGGILKKSVWGAKYLLLAAVLCLLLIDGPLFGENAIDTQHSPSWDLLKAAMISKFPEFVTWPEGSTGRSDPLIIGTIGKSAVPKNLQELSKYLTKDARPRMVKELKDIKEVGRCGILFIAKSELPRIDALLKRTVKRPILTIGDSSEFARSGVLINFYREGKHIRFEINKPAVTASGLHMSFRLFQVARVYDPEGYR